jgi:hypothetical protein
MSAKHCVVPLGDAEIFMDPEDLETLQEVIAAGWRLEMHRDRRNGTQTLTLVLRGVVSIKLARAIMQATENQYVFQTGPWTAGRATWNFGMRRRIGWSSRINGSGSKAAPSA